MIGGPLGWLIGGSVLSAVAAFVLVSVVKQLVELAGIAKVVLFSATWTAVTTMAGMRSMTGKARKLRASNARVMRALKNDK